MALVKFGAGIADMRGSIGGTTFARNRFGAVARNRTVGVNPQSARQQQMQQIISQLTPYWNQTMTAANRSLWNAYAAAVAWTNKLGETQFLTGFNMFVRSNSARLQAAAAIVPAGPAIMSLPEQDSSIVAIITASSQLISLAFDNTQPWAHETGGYMLVKQGTPVNATRNFFKGPWRYAGKIVGNTSTAPTSPQTMSCPFTVAVGQKVYIECRISRADGRLSNPFCVSSTVV